MSLRLAGQASGGAGARRERRVSGEVRASWRGSSGSLAASVRLLVLKGDAIVPTMNTLLSPDRTQRGTLLAGTVLTAVTAVVFWPVGSYEFIQLDDLHYIANNAVIRKGLSVETARWAFTSFHLGNWHPVTWLSHALDVSVFGLAPGPHHLVNLFWHIAATLLLFLVLQRATGALWKSATVGALFALHPLHVESVAWAAERKDVLSAFFLMLTILLYLGYVRRPRSGAYVSVLAAYALGLMSKPMLVTVPFLLLLLDWWPLNRLRKAYRPVVVEKVPLLVLAAAISAVTLVAQSRAGALPPEGVLSLPARIGNAVVAGAVYLIKTFWPHPLSVYYPLGNLPPPVWQVAGAAVLLAALTVGAATSLRTRPYFAAGLFWYLGSLAPVSGLIQAGQQSMADRYTYLPLIGIFVAAVWGTADFLARRTFRAAMPVVGALVLVPLIVVTRASVGYWKDSVTLFTHAVEAVPGNWYMHYNLGSVLARQRDFRGAIFHLSECIRLHPGYVDAYNDLGLLLATTGRRAEAKRILHHALGLRPGLAEAHYNLALVHIDEGDREKAMERYRLLQGLDPGRAALLLKMMSPRQWR